MTLGQEKTLQALIQIASLARGSSPGSVAIYQIADEAIRQHAAARKQEHTHAESGLVRELAEALEDASSIINAIDNTNSAGHWIRRQLEALTRYDALIAQAKEPAVVSSKHQATGQYVEPIDPRNDRICHYQRILNAFVNAQGYCNIRGAAERIVELEEW